MIRVRVKAAESTKSVMGNNLQLGIYEHYKGNRYEVIAVAEHSETGERFVVYKALYGTGTMYIRPFEMFVEDVEVDGRGMPRFRWCKNSATPGVA